MKQGGGRDEFVERIFVVRYSQVSLDTDDINFNEGRINVVAA